MATAFDTHDLPHIAVEQIVLYMALVINVQSIIRHVVVCGIEEASATDRTLDPR